MSGFGSPCSWRFLLFHTEFWRNHRLHPTYHLHPVQCVLLGASQCLFPTNHSVLLICQSQHVVSWRASWLRWMGSATIAVAGCPTPLDSCSLCPKGEPVPHPDNTLIFLTESFSCGIAEAITASNPGALYGVDDSVYCLLMQYRSGACGCKPGWLQIVLPWTFRIYGMLSLLVSPSNA